MPRTGESRAKIPEVRQMVEAARRYVAGEISIIEFSGATSICAIWCEMFDVDPALKELALNWRTWADQTWNEWGMCKDPMTPAQLRELLARDLGETS